MNTSQEKKMSKTELLCSIDCCTSIAQMFELVRQEQIDIRMQNLCSASCIPPKELRLDYDSPEAALDRLKDAIRLAVENTR